MHEPFTRIAQTEGLSESLSLVRKAQAGVRLRSRARAVLGSELRTSVMIMAGWWCVAAVLLHVLPNTAGDFVMEIGKVQSAIALAVVMMLGWAFPNVICSEITSHRPDFFTSWRDARVWLGLAAFGPLAAGIRAAIQLSASYGKPVLTYGYAEDTVSAEDVLRDERATSLYADLAAQVDDWSESMTRVNRLISLANNGVITLTQEDENLIADCARQRREIEPLVGLGNDLSKEGALGDRPGTCQDHEDPIQRIADRMPRLREQSARLQQDSRQLVAAREVSSLSNVS